MITLSRRGCAQPQQREKTMFGKGGLGNLMKQAQQMQDKMAKVQEEIAALEVTGESGAGLVKVTINGAHNCRRVEVDPSLLEDDKDMLEDLSPSMPFIFCSITCVTESCSVFASAPG